MAVHTEGIFNCSLTERIRNCNLLIVGAGGIGCELLKNLVLTGFEKLHVIDLDTIELSNLNRQFLFHKQHIGRPKAVVARESVLKFNPKANIIAEHDSITNIKYDVNFFRQFTVVANALDNIAARSHVNRMCLAADVPLIESGSSGYAGQVTVYKKKVSECYECLPRRREKDYAGCTIRNTPSEHVHCIVWAKHLFNQLFGETDADAEVSPDLSDPNLEKQEQKQEEDGNIVRISTREWANSVDYDPGKLFEKLFETDINYLKTMTNLWETRKSPRALIDSEISNEEAVSDGTNSPSINCLEDQKIWSLQKCRDTFSECVKTLTARLKSGNHEDNLIWDKDDECAMNFVAVCSNMRAWCFYINMKTKFEVKSIAGNIIPAIASTNAVISGLLVMQIIKVLQGDLSKCRTSWLNITALKGRKMISSSQLEKPNPKCMVCSPKTPEISVLLNLDTLTVRTLNDKILKERLHVVQPDIIVNDNSGKVLVSSDPDEYDEELMNKTLANFALKTDCQLCCEDFFQHYKINVTLKHSSELKDQEFEFEADVDELVSQAKLGVKESINSTESGSSNEDIMEVGKENDTRVSMKTKASENVENEPPAKKRKSTAE